MDPVIDYGMFEGDGRETVYPSFSMVGTRPIPVRRATCKLLIDHFNMAKHSSHSLAGGTLWVILQWCNDTKHSYKLTAVPGLGFQVELTE